MYGIIRRLQHIRISSLVNDLQAVCATDLTNFIVGYPPLHYYAMLRYVPWDNWLEKSRNHE